MKTRIPTIGQIVRAYPLIAAAERMKCERPGKLAVANVISGVRHVCKILQMKDTCRWSKLDRNRIDTYLTRAAQENIPSVTAWSYVNRVQALCAKWCQPYWESRGWEVAPLTLPVCRRKPTRYIRPERDILLKVKEWYDSLMFKEDRRDWIVATLMLEFAMRNGDIGRWKWSNFRERDGIITLCYTPHKTALTSGRSVAWPVHSDIWDRLHELRGQADGQKPVVANPRETFVRLNKEIKTCGFFHGTHKGLYELRKICIDHVYQRFGAEMASSISGDDIRTVTRYYADPSAVNILGVRIVDLL